MKNKWHVLLILTFFVLADGFGQQNSGDINSDLLKEMRNIVTLLQSVMGEGTSSKRTLVPLTMDLVSLINNENSDLFKGLEFHLSSDLALTTNPERKVESVNGGLIIDNGNTVQITKILRTGKGEYYKHDLKTNEESFLIKFPGYDHVLQFIINPQTNRFDFYATEESATFISPRPFLCIFVNQTGDALPQRSITLQQSSQPQFPIILPTADQFPVFIMSSGKLSKEAVVSYIASKGTIMNRQQIDTLVSLYIREAQIEGINHDIAIAQMCYATKFLYNQQQLNIFNYGGLNTDSGISVRGGGRHLNMAEGVRAHIQHLKGYASREPLRNELVDARYNYLITSGVMGTVKTLDGLFVKWSPYNYLSYGNEIRKILSELYLFSGRLI